METHNFEMNPFTLAFKSPDVEGEFLGEIANRRWPVLIFIFCFDVLCFLFRFVAKWTAASADECSAAGPSVRPFEVLQEMGHQLANMAMLYVVIGLLNKRARKAGNNAARQEEVLLSICMGLAICNLLASLGADNAQDYVYMGYFLICTSTFLKIRWWVGTGLLATPTVAVQLWHNQPPSSSILPPDAVVHIVVAWAVGGLMAYLNDWYRRQMFANSRMASAAHDKEMMEATARIQAQRELAAAQAQAAQRALIVAREKAAHEAKSEFMSLMCHEVRTPLNGCLASAEMLLETPLKEEQRELANTIRVSGSILLSTVSNFLDFFKLEAGKRLDIVRSEICLSDMVGDVHCIIEAMIGRGGAVSLQQPQLLEVPERVFADPDRLRGILLNLYTNAAKFTKRGHIVLRVRCVSRDFTPPAKSGYNAIMLQPTYHPSHVSHRSMDISSLIVMAPAPDGSNEQQDTQQQQQQQQDVSAPAGADSPRQQQQQQQQQQQTRKKLGARVSFHDQVHSRAGPQRHQSQSGQHLLEQHVKQGSKHSYQQQQQQQHNDDLAPFWHQASQWARNLLASGQEDLLHVAASHSTAVVQDNSATTAAGSNSNSTDNSDSGSGGMPCVPCKSDGASEVSRSPQYDVHACTVDNPADQHATVQPLSAEHAGDGAGSTTGDTADQQQQQQQQQVAPPLAPGALPPSGASSSSRRRSGSSDDACWLLFEVEDTGVGITRDGLAMLFREYVQGTDDEMCKPRTRGGTGLGLSICSKQVGVLGGVIGAHSCRGQGSMFWFKIPTYVRLSKSLSTDSNTSLPRQSLDLQRQQQQQQQQQQQHAASSSSEQLALSRQPQQQQEQQEVQPPADDADKSPMGGSKRDDSTSSASNIGTYNVIHSGLYHSSLKHTAEPSATGVVQGSANLAASGDTIAQTAAAAKDAVAGAASTPAAVEGAGVTPHNRDAAGAVKGGGGPAGPGSALTASPAAGTGHAAAGSDGEQLSSSAVPAAMPSSTRDAGAVVKPGSTSALKPPQPPNKLAAAASSSAAAAVPGGSTAAVVNSPGPGAAGSSAASLPRARQSLSLDGRVPAGPALHTQKLLGKRVLLAEDNLINQTVARKMLSSLGMQVEVAANGLEAFNAVQRVGTAAAEAGGASGKMFALILMDMAMPVMGGVEATKAIRAAGYKLPIVAMTANASDSDKEECAAAGMDGFLSKPVLRDQLARAMMAVLEEHEAVPIGNRQ